MPRCGLRQNVERSGGTTIGRKKTSDRSAAKAAGVGGVG